jgi:hypothetical protein
MRTNLQLITSYSLVWNSLVQTPLGSVQLNCNERRLILPHF